MATKVTNTVSHETTQGGVITATKGKLAIVIKDNLYPEIDSIGYDHRNNRLFWCKTPPSQLSISEGLNYDLVLPYIISTDKNEILQKGDKVLASRNGKYSLEVITHIFNDGFNVSTVEWYLIEPDKGEFWLPKNLLVGKILVEPNEFSEKHLMAIVNGKILDGDEILVEVTKVVRVESTEAYEDDEILVDGNWIKNLPSDEEYDLLQHQTIKLNTQGNCILHKIDEKKYSINDMKIIALKAFFDSPNIKDRKGFEKWWNESGSLYQPS